MDKRRAEKFKEWQKKWAKIRREYLEDQLTTRPIVNRLLSGADGGHYISISRSGASNLPPVPDGGYWWMCPECFDEGRSDTYGQAEVQSMNHLLTHTTPQQEGELDVMKMRLMPEEFMTPSQLRRKALIGKEGEERVADAVATLRRIGIKGSQDKDKGV